MIIYFARDFAFLQLVCERFVIYNYHFMLYWLQPQSVKEVDWLSTRYTYNAVFHPNKYFLKIKF